MQRGDARRVVRRRVRSGRRRGHGGVVEIDEVRSIDSRQRHTWARPSAASFAPVRPPAFTPPPRRPAASRAAAPARGRAILRLQRAQAGGAAIDEAQRRGQAPRCSSAQPARPARWPRPGRRRPLPACAPDDRIRGRDDAGPASRRRGRPSPARPRAASWCSSGASSTSAGRDRRAAQAGAQTGPVASASSGVTAHSRGQSRPARISASTRRVFSRRPPRSAGGCGCRDARPRNAPAGG